MSTLRFDSLIVAFDGLSDGGHEEGETGNGREAGLGHVHPTFLILRWLLVTNYHPL